MKHLLSVILWVGVLLGLVAVLAPWIGKDFYLLDLAASFQLQYAFLALIALILAWYVRSRFLCVSYIVVLACAFLHLWPYIIPKNTSLEQEEAKSFTILQHNVHYLKVDIDAVIADIKQHADDVDVVFLQEAPTALKYKVREELANLYPYQIVYPSKRWHGKILLSRFPIHSNALLTYPNMERDIQGVHALLDVNGTAVSLYGIHTSSPISLEFYRKRNLQLQHIAEVISQDNTAHKMVLGDFNATPYHGYYKQALKASGLQDGQEALGLNGTWPSMFPALFHIPIDHLWYSDAFEIMSRSIAAANGSDHFSVLTSLKL